MCDSSEEGHEIWDKYSVVKASDATGEPNMFILCITSFERSKSSSYKAWYYKQLGQRINETCTSMKIRALPKFT